MRGGRAAYVGSTILIRVVVQSGSTLSILLIGKFLGQVAVATYSVALAAVWLSAIVFLYGAPVLMRRYFVMHPDLPALTVYRRCQAGVFRSPRRYAAAGVLLLLLAVYVNHTIGTQAVVLLVLMTPLGVILSMMSMKVEYHKAIGQAIPASLFELGSLHLVISLLIIATLAVGLSDLTGIFSAGAVVFLALAAIGLIAIRRVTRGEIGLRDPAAQRKILANNLLMFVFRNGFPLFFAAFMLVSDLGHFRLEERLFFLLLFFYALFETLGMKTIIAAFRGDHRGGAVRFYALSVTLIFAIGLVTGLIMYAALSVPALAGLIGYSRTGTAALLMALAMPFYFLTYYNNLVLNLLGHHGRCLWGLLAIAVTFIAGAYALYPALGIDGVRAAYLCGGVFGSAFSGAMILMTLRRPAPAPGPQA